MGTNFTEPIVIAKLMWIHDEGAAHAMGVGGLGLHTHARTHAHSPHPVTPKAGDATAKWQQRIDAATPRCKCTRQSRTIHTHRGI